MAIAMVTGKKKQNTKHTVCVRARVGHTEQTICGMGEFEALILDYRKENDGQFLDIMAHGFVVHTWFGFKCMDSTYIDRHISTCRLCHSFSVTRKSMCAGVR